MKRNNFAAAIMAGLIFATSGTATVAAQSVSAANQEKGYKLLEATDQVLAYHGDYSATISLVIEKPGKPNENLQFKIFQRVDDELLTLVQLFPEADKGTGYLMDGDNIWAYDPIGRKFTHTSLKEAIGDSDIKIDDINRSENTWRENYDVTGFSESTLGQYPVYIVTITAKTLEPAYNKSIYYIRKDLPLVLKIENYSSSGRLMRTMLMPKYTKVPTGYVATQSIIRDEINQGENTQQVISNLTFDALPDYIFTKAYLEGLN